MALRGLHPVRGTHPSKRSQHAAEHGRVFRSSPVKRGAAGRSGAAALLCSVMSARCEHTQAVLLPSVLRAACAAGGTGSSALVLYEGSDGRRRLYQFRPRAARSLQSYVASACLSQPRSCSAAAERCLWSELLAQACWAISSINCLARKIPG